MNLDKLKRKFDEYEKARAEFAKTHDSIFCDNCACKIEPGEDIVITPDDDHFFCSEECASEYYGFRSIIFNVGDYDYESCFPKKEGES